MSIRVCATREVVEASIDGENSSNTLANAKRVPGSGQTLLQKFSFAVSLVSPMASAATFGFGKDVYILTLAADVKLMGAIGTVLAVWGPMCGPLAGYCMDKDLLGRWFAWESWGRRAPWYLTHLLLAAVSTAAVYLPPSDDPQLLCWWFLAWGMLSTWLLGICFNCIDSTRVEMYPTKEERSEIESLIKLMAGLGSGLGAVPQLLVMQSHAPSVLVGLSFFTCLVGLISLASVPILRTALQAFDGSHIESFFREFASLAYIPVFRHFLLYRFIEALLIAILLTNGLYYITLNTGLAGGARSLAIVGIGIMIAIVTVLLIPIWTQFFRLRRQGVNANVVCGFVLLLGLLAPCALAVSNVVFPPLVGFFVYIFILQATITGQTYWRANALGWVVDEDCQAKVGRRREAVFVGTMNFVTALARALAVGLVLNGLSWAGLDIVNCEQLCSDLDVADLPGCLEGCDVNNYERQPEIVRWYVGALYYYLVPLCQVTCALLCYTFPIHGARLDAIYARQMELYTPRAVVGASSEVGVDVVDGSHCTTPRSPAHASSVDADADPYPSQPEGFPNSLPLEAAGKVSHDTICYTSSKPDVKHS